METPEIGDKVRITSVVDCEQEFVGHGINPHVAGRVGKIVYHDSRVSVAGHSWGVNFNDGHAAQWFKASEMEPATTQAPEASGQ